MTGLPIDLIFVRHGQSESNVVQRAEKDGGLIHPATEKIYERYDADQRLTVEGIRQADNCGRWIEENIDHPEDYRRFVSPYMRTLETAAYLGDYVYWPDAALVERDWGIFGQTPHVDREAKFAEIVKMLKATAFFARMTGGESIHDLTMRVRQFLDTCSRNNDDHVMAVTHGEFMWGARFVLERMMPHEWESYDADQELRIGNCCVMHYTRRCPWDPKVVVDSMSEGWRRMVNTPHPEQSPYCGEWVSLNCKRTLNPDQLLEIVNTRPPLLTEESDDQKLQADQLVNH